MKLVPLNDRVVLKQLVAEETTKSGIVLPGQAKEKPQQAEVMVKKLKWKLKLEIKLFTLNIQEQKLNLMKKNI